MKRLSTKPTRPKNSKSFSTEALHEIAIAPLLVSTLVT